jgi:hypothetical protein
MGTPPSYRPAEQRGKNTGADHARGLAPAKRRWSKLAGYPVAVAGREPLDWNPGGSSWTAPRAVSHSAAR